MKLKYQLFSLAFGTMLSATVISAQSCPNWSAKFDKITNKGVLNTLRNSNWDDLIAASGGPEAIIAASRVTLRDARERLQGASEAAHATSANPGEKIDDLTWEDCKSAEGANMAAKCEYLNMSELILTLEGTIELAQCRQDHQ